MTEPTLYAQEMLLEVAKPDAGYIIRGRTEDGLSIKTNQREFVSKTTPLSAQAWQGALNDLVRNGFVNRDESSTETYVVTPAGIAMREELIKLRGQQNRDQ